MVLPEQLNDTNQPRPVVDAAQNQNTRAKWIGAIAAVLGALPSFLLAFGLIDWSGEQIAAYTAFLGVTTGAVSFVIGSSDVKTALQVESQVTPVASPRDDQGAPFVPVAIDSYEDEEVQ